MDLPGKPEQPEGMMPRPGGVPDPNLWRQRQIAGAQNLNDPEGTGMSPFTLPFFVPPAIPATSFNLPWSGLPPAGGFIPFTPFMLPATYYMPMSFPTNQGWPFVGGSGFGNGGGGLQVSYTSASGVETVDAQLLDFTSWTIGDVVETPAGSGNIVIQQPATGGAGTLTVATGDTSGSGPLVLVSGGPFSGNITLGFNYDTVTSFDSTALELKLQDIPPNVTTAATIPSTTIQTDLTVDTKGRVTAQTTRDIGLFMITKTARVDTQVYWTYTLRRLRDGSANPTPPPNFLPITTFPFSESAGATYTAYNGLEAANTGSTVYGLTVLSAAGTGTITLDGTYAGFEYGPVPEGSIVIAMKEGDTNPKWWFNASNTITGTCPTP
jgi:hypothetical protein